VIAALSAAGWAGLSPEAESGAAAYEAVRGRELDALRDCASGQELIKRRFAADVEIAGEVGCSNAVPHLIDGLIVPG